MNERDYRSQQSTNRQFNLEMIPVMGGFGGLRRENSNKFFQMQQQMLQRSLSRESVSAGDKSKQIRKYEENASLKHSRSSKSNKQSAKNIQYVNNVIAQSYGKGEAQEDANPIQPAIRRAKFQFNILSYIVQVALGYGITIGLMYLIKVSNFPFFQILLVFGLMVSVTPWSFTNIFMMIVCCGVIIANYFLNIQILTYPIILIFYFSLQAFNECNKCKILFIPVFIIIVVWLFIQIPSLYYQFALGLKNPLGFYYVFPLYTLLARVFLYMSYRWIEYSQYIFLQLPLFILGIEYGVMMTLKVDSIEFWYLIVAFTLLITNDRTQFMVNLLVNVVKHFEQNKKEVKNEKVQKKDLEELPQIKNKQILNDEKTKQSKPAKKSIPILHAHASGYSCMNFFHIVGIVYVFTRLPIYSQPYSQNTRLYIYIENQYYIPLVVWAFGFVYEAMCLVLERKRKDKLLIGFPNNGIWQTILRGFILALGLWMFYVGLGMAYYAISKSSITS